MLFESMCHSVICVHRPVECEGRIPPRPCSMPRRTGRLHTELSGELRDSDGLELICLCCWCYACFIFGNGRRGGSSFSFSLPLPVCLFLSEFLIISVSPVIALQQLVVVVNVCSRPERLSPHFSMVES